MQFINRYMRAIALVFFALMFIKVMLCLVLLGILFLFLGITSLLFLRKMQSQGQKATGRILSASLPNTLLDTPTIEFTSIQGETIQAKPYLYTFSDLSGTWVYGELVNSEIPIAYDPSNPGKFIVERASNKWLIYVAFTVTGLCLASIGIACIIPLPV
jgi:hypothetical protein